MAPGGIETLVSDLKLATSPENRFVIFSLQGSTNELIQKWPALNQYRSDLFGFEAPHSGRHFSVIPKLRQAMISLRATDVFVHHIGPLLYGGIAARLAGVRRLVHVEHDAWHYDQFPSHQRIVGWCETLLRPEHFAVSLPIKRRLQQLIGARGNVKFVPPGIDTMRFRVRDKSAARRRLGISTELKIIGSAGRLAPVKGHGVLLEAMRLLPRDVQLIIVGDGEERERLQRQADDSGLHERVTFLGHRDDMADIFPALDVFCLPSLNEGLPRVIIEAQSCGVPVVASDVGAMRDAVHPETGRLVGAGDAGALGAALSATLEQAGNREATRAFVCSQFDFTKIRQHYAASGDGDHPHNSLREGVSAA